MSEKRNNPERVLVALAAYLKAYPFMRAGQAISNALPARLLGDAFYVDDDTLAANLERAAKGAAE
jgi:hypothetical protein